MKGAGPSPVLDTTDQWFLRHGLTYFVPEQRAAVRAVHAQVYAQVVTDRAG